MKSQQGLERRYTLGFLSDNPIYESESLIFRGAKKAAEEHDVNLICLTPLNGISNTQDAADSKEHTSATSSFDYNQLKKHLDSFDIDGLIYIGWSKLFQDDDGYKLRDALHPIHLLSISGNSIELPSVLVKGGAYIQQLTHHLAVDHGKRSIAFVNSWSEDDRLLCYSEAMQELHIYDERFIVRVNDLADYSNPEERMKRSLDLLLGERGLRVDAIMVMNAYDGVCMLKELMSRGFTIPDDIALVCYEDHPIIEFCKPSLTTVFFPFEDLGYHATNNLVKLLNGQDIPQIHEIDARVIYRDSCGCTVNSIKPMSPYEYPSELTNADTYSIQSITEIAQEMRESFVSIMTIDYARLANSFLTSITLTTSDFLTLLNKEVSKLHSWDNDILQSMVDRFRELLRPLIRTQSDQYERAEMLWFMARYMLKDYNNSAAVGRYIDHDQRNYILSILSQHILSARSIPELNEVLNDNLGWIQIETQYLLLKTNQDEELSTMNLIFAYDEHRIQTSDYLADSNITEIFYRFKEKKNRRFNLVVMPLCVNEKTIGLAWSEPGDHSISLIFSLCGSISKGIESSLVLEQSNELVRRLSAEIILRQQKEAQLAYYADVDSLTHLFNRRYFYDTITSISENEPHFTIFYMDIDGFKQVNDTMGHDAGDELLIEIAHRLSDTLTGATFPITQTDLHMQKTNSSSIFRLGGDEFTAILRTVDPIEVTLYARRTVEAIHQPYFLSGRVTHISVSIGIALYPLDSNNSKLLLKHADTALYKAKAVKDSFLFYGNLII